MIERPKRRPTPVVIGHRGAKGLAPENTLAAVRRGLDERAQFIEVDVQRSADGVLVVVHDARVDRTTTGYGRVKSLSHEQLNTLSSRAQAGTAVHIPTLRDVIDLVKASSAQLVIELKHPRCYPGIEVQVARLLRERGMQNRAVIISFYRPSLCRYRRAVPGALTGLLRFWPGPLPSDAPTLLDLHWLGLILCPWYVRRCHARGVAVWAWTVNNRWLMCFLKGLGVDGITTDRPDRAYRLFYGAPPRSRARLVRRR